MSSSTSAPARSEILRGAPAARVSPARLDADLRQSPYATARLADPRLVDPTLAKAFEEAVSAAGAQARAAGFEQGRAEGREAVERESASLLEQEMAAVRDREQGREESLRRALAVLEDAAVAFAGRQAAALRDVEDLVLNAALDLATTLLGRELESTTAPVRDAVRRALSVLPGDVPVTVVVNPIDAAALGDLDALAAGRSVRVVTDPDVEPGSCLADGGATRVDASLSAAIERVRQVLAR